jgi:hypothetical protein
LQQFGPARTCEYLSQLPAGWTPDVAHESESSRYASPLNWIQLGTELLVPHYTLTQQEDIEQTSVLLTKEGFNPTFIKSPTLDTGGSLHYLTTSIYL